MEYQIFCTPRLPSKHEATGTNDVIYLQVMLVCLWVFKVAGSERRGGTDRKEVEWAIKYTDTKSTDNGASKACVEHDKKFDY